MSLSLLFDTEKARGKVSYSDRVLSAFGIHTTFTFGRLRELLRPSERPPRREEPRPP